MMSLLDLTLTTPAENLALDEALLDECDGGSGGESLRFWEPTTPFVVVGYANSVAHEVQVTACQTAGVPIHRRCTGGGTVLQMPGVLNYNLVLRIPENGPLSQLSTTNQWIMSRLCDALAGLSLASNSEELVVRGVSDLCLGNRKVMGSAQRRKKSALVFHGSLLLNADLSLIEKFLRFPSKQPDYRADRSHLDFCTNLSLESGAAKQAIARAWGSPTPLTQIPQDRLNQLLHDRYGRADWNHKL